MIKHVSLAAHVDLYQTVSGSWKATEVESGVTSSAWLFPEHAVQELVRLVARGRIVIQDPPQQQKKRG